MASSAQLVRPEDAKKLSPQRLAHVSVFLIDGDGESPAQVFGNMSYTVDSDPKVEFYNKSESEAENLYPNNPIHLNEHMLMPTSAKSFKVHAKLWDYDHLSPNDEIANGTATFEVLPEGNTADEYITGLHGKIKVSVAWSITNSSA